ncbi:MAG: ABC transporter permease [Rhodospirillaceae bacterium]|nr:ABC transporter permease [Rhodospirillaceae bacterium]
MSIAAPPTGQDRRHPVATNETRSRIDFSPIAPFLDLWRNRALLAAMTRREIESRYRGSALGFLWSLATPLLTLVVYTFVFSVIFRVRWGASTAGHGEFALVAFAGLLVFTCFSDCVTRAPTLVLAQANMVKKVVFPVQILPAVILGGALFHLLIATAVLLVIAAFLGFTPGITALAFPLVLAPLLLGILGITWAVSAAGVYFRDLGQAIGLLVTLLMFLIPIFYPIGAVPEAFRPIITLNPLAILVEEARGVLLWGRSPDWVQLAWVGLLGWAVAWGGYLFFMKLRRGFSDVL